MEPEAKTPRVQRPSERKLGLGILPFDTGHHPGAGLFVYDIGQMHPGLRSKTQYTPTE
jgi:hypothetical protein